MSLTVSANHMVLTDAIREYAESKIRGVVSMFPVQTTRITLKNEKGVKKAQAEIGMKGVVFHIEESDESLYAAIDRLENALHQKLSRRKGREERERRRRDESED